MFRRYLAGRLWLLSGPPRPVIRRDENGGRGELGGTELHKAAANRTGGVGGAGFVRVVAFAARRRARRCRSGPSGPLLRPYTWPRIAGVYARSGRAWQVVAWDERLRLGACGDWLIGPRVENTWLSGRRLARVVLGAVGSAASYDDAVSVASLKQVMTENGSAIAPSAPI